MCIQAFWTEISADRLNTVLDDLLEELKIAKRQRIREIMKRPEQETLIQSSQNREDKVFRVQFISNGDPPQTCVVGSFHLHHILAFTQNLG